MICLNHFTFTIFLKNTGNVRRFLSLIFNTIFFIKFRFHLISKIKLQIEEHFKNNYDKCKVEAFIYKKNIFEKTYVTQMILNSLLKQEYK